MTARRFGAMSKTGATIAALEWVGMYEADDTPAMRDGDTYATCTLEDAVRETREHYAGSKTRVTAYVVARRYPGFPDDIVAAHFMLERMYVKATS